MSDDQEQKQFVISFDEGTDIVSAAVQNLLETAAMAGIMLSSGQAAALLVKSAATGRTCIDPVELALVTHCHTPEELDKFARPPTRTVH